MKTKKSIAHFSRQEQEALSSLKKKLIEAYNPLLIYLIAIENTHRFKRDSLAYPMKSIQNRFRIDVLVIVPEDQILFNQVNKIYKVHSDISKVNMIIYPIGEFQDELKNHSVFFSAIHKRSIVLHEHANSLEELPETQFNNQTHKEELIKYTSQNPNYENYQVETLHFSDGENIASFRDFIEVPILSKDLQHAFAKLLKQFGAKAINVCLRKVILEYAYKVGEAGVPNDFDRILITFEYLMELFDIAELEFKEAK